MTNLNWKPFIYGGMASIVAEFGTFPIDLTKTRLQVQGQSQYTEVRYRGMFHALFRIGKEEGIRALYSGISPALLRQASYGTIKIGTYNSLKRLFVSRPEDETMVLNVFCGVVSGVLSSSLANPTDVLKIRMQAQGSLLQGSMMSNFINIYQTEGTRGLWRGVIPTAQRAAIVVGVELPVYDITKKHLLRSGLMGDTILAHFMSLEAEGLLSPSGTLIHCVQQHLPQTMHLIISGMRPIMVNKVSKLMQLQSYDLDLKPDMLELIITALW
uniref:Solute carrier family 25 member 14 n=1 Tax=Lates calcarifer TaxID=8187 RepID=A0A4W6FMA8_LATCA